MATASRRVTISINGNLFPFLKQPKFFMRNIPGYQNGKDAALILTMDHIRQNDLPLPQFGLSTLTLVETFLKAVYGKSYTPDHPANKNVFAVTYSQNQLKFFGSPVICKWEGRPQLIFGSETKATGTQFNKIPLVLKDGFITLEGSSIKLLEPSTMEVPDFSSNDPNARKKVNTLIFGAENITFTLNVKLHDSIDELTFKEIWNTKDLAAISNVMTSIYGYGANYSYMFSKWFQFGMFPPKGVVLKIVGAKETIGKDDRGRPLKGAIFILDTSDLPPIDVLCSDAKTKEKFDAPLNEVTSLLCGGTQNITQQFLNRWMDAPTPDAPWYLHIEGPGKAFNTVPRDGIYDLDWIPEATQEVIDLQKSDPSYLTSSMANVHSSSRVASNAAISAASEDEPNYDDNPL